MNRVLFGVAALSLTAALFPATASATTHLLPQVKSMSGCLVKPGTGKRPIAHLTVCGANYTDVLLAVNARRETYAVAVGIHRAQHRPIQACRCAAGLVLQKAQQVAQFTRRRFRDWWANPKTSAGHKLKGCLKNAALALGGYFAYYVATGNWDDNQALWLTGVACGVGSIVDA